MTIKDSFLLDDTSIRLLFDSVLITLEVYHDPETGTGATEVRRVDRFDYELTHVLNWCSFKLDTKNKNSTIIEPTVQMTGRSKINQMPFYDWDYVEKFVHNIKEDDRSLTQIEDYFIVFNEFESERT